MRGWIRIQLREGVHSSIAGISLLVGGIGIMNVMLATVTERTREIGIRRALGVKRRHIVTQFLVETVVLSVGGGVVRGLGGSLGTSDPHNTPVGPEEPCVDQEACDSPADRV